ncbi:MAG: leucine-rich repeat protein [Lachnospiraceae bacterium]|nr:leucine-rich repeat protein [Lachnospiraceae bacterium]
MKKQLLSFMLVLCLVMSMIPVTALAEENGQESKTVITAVDELLQFAKDVNAGKYDNRTNAVVSLEADLDLTGVEWTPIGCTNDEGDVEHYFSGKFYGNGHSISNIDYASMYGKEDIGGLFGFLGGAEISGLTLKGNIDDVGEGYVFLGTLAGYTDGAKISDCISEVVFNNHDKYINGTFGLCGYAGNTVIEYCQNKGNITITNDVSSFYVGGIAGMVMGTSEIRYCSNSGDIKSYAPQTGGIAGQISETAKIINCCSTGKLTPLGKGTTDMGGIVGTVGTNSKGGSDNTVSHCYFGGEIDLTQYTATLPYKRFGAIAGKKDSSDKALATFENNFFAETENVSACANKDGVGIAKTIEYMKTEDFYNEISAAGGIYRFSQGETPLLPNVKYSVSFTVTPAELTGVTIKVNGEEVTNPAELEAGTYPLQITADNCETLNVEITITGDTATHTQTFTLKYKDADYTKVDAAITKANALKKDDYKDFSAVQEAIEKVVRGKNITEQTEVDQMAKAIEDAIAALEKKPVETDKPQTPQTPSQDPDQNTIGIFTYRITGKDTAEILTTTVNGDKKKDLKIFSTAKLILGERYKITSVAANALKGNKKVKTLTIGKNTVKIGKGAFQNCKNLKKIVIKSKKLKKIGSNAFKGISKKAVVKVPKSKKKLYTKLLRASGLPKSVKIK